MSLDHRELMERVDTSTSLVNGCIPAPLYRELLSPSVARGSMVVEGGKPPSDAEDVASVAIVDAAVVAPQKTPQSMALESAR